MVDSEVSWLGVVVAPGGEVIISLAGAAVDLDLDTTNLHHHIMVMSASGLEQSYSNQSAPLSLVQIPPDTTGSFVEPPYAGAKVYAITIHLKASKMSVCCYGMMCKWLPCTERIYCKQPYAIKIQLGSLGASSCVFMA